MFLANPSHTPVFSNMLPFVCSEGTVYKSSQKLSRTKYVAFLGICDDVINTYEVALPTHFVVYPLLL